MSLLVGQVQSGQSDMASLIDHPQHFKVHRLDGTIQQEQVSVKLGKWCSQEGGVEDQSGDQMNDPGTDFTGHPKSSAKRQSGPLPWFLPCRCKHLGP